MSVSSKCYYAIRAIYALAEHDRPEPMKIAEIAELEQIPIRFLEVILSQLKGAGFAAETLHKTGGVGEERMQHFHRHLPIQVGMAGFIHFGHAAAPDQAFQDVLTKSAATVIGKCVAGCVAHRGKLYVK